MRIQRVQHHNTVSITYVAHNTYTSDEKHSNQKCHRFDLALLFDVSGMHSWHTITQQSISMDIFNEIQYNKSHLMSSMHWWDARLFTPEFFVWHFFLRHKISKHQTYSWFGLQFWNHNGTHSGWWKPVYDDEPSSIICCSLNKSHLKLNMQIFVSF